MRKPSNTRPERNAQTPEGRRQGNADSSEQDRGPPHETSNCSQPYEDIHMKAKVPTNQGRQDSVEAPGMNHGRRAFVFGTPLAAASLAWAPQTFAASRQDFNSLGTWAAPP